MDRSLVDRTRLGPAAACVLLVAIVVGAVWLAVSDPGRGARRSTAPAVPAPVSVAADRCRLASGPTGVPASTPADVTWDRFGAGLEPSSPTAGPGLVDGPIARCYAHTPEGAVFAAVQIPDRLSLAGPDDWERVASAQLVAGPGRDAFVTRVRAAYGAAAPGSSGWPAQLAGFRVVAYDPAQATIAVVYRTDRGALVASDVTVAWVDGDWKVALLPDGSPGPPPVVVGSLDGYVELRGA